MVALQPMPSALEILRGETDLALGTKRVKKSKRNWLGFWLRRKCLMMIAMEGMVCVKNILRLRRY